MTNFITKFRHYSQTIFVVFMFYPNVPTIFSFAVGIIRNNFEKSMYVLWVKGR